MDFDDLLAEATSDAVGQKRLRDARRKLSTAVASDGRVTLKSKRLEMGMSQAELAKEIGTSQPHIARLESGGDPQLSTVRRIANCFGISLGDAASLFDPE
ncbi:helix-turn-helix transcriptional regulator [Paraburkholderia terrae]|uniref:helix-turn-helix transcriptional regulator n=1 Tax=Paraburkholderia terrae TaxID=311230 RepID=UPI0020C1686D|nr:helix-turn-helix transcriptional regulator [Paraburkholderia terrae]